LNFTGIGQSSLALLLIQIWKRQINQKVNIKVAQPALIVNYDFIIPGMNSDPEDLKELVSERIP
jgi:hypothetical protein